MAASPEKPKPSSLVPYFMLMAHGTILGALFSANKIAIEGGIPFLGYAFWQSLGAGAILLVVSLVVGNPLQLSMAHLRTYIVTGVGGIAVPFSVYAYLAPKLPAGVITLVLTLIPPLTYLFAYALGLERFRWLCIAGILFGVAGVSLVVVPETSLPSPDMAKWVLVALLAPLSAAVTNVFAQRFRPPRTSSLTLACGLLLGSAVVLFPIMMATGSLYLFPDPPSPGDWALFAVVLINAVMFILFFEIIRLAGAVFFSQVNYVGVLDGILWAMVVFGERHSAWIWIALVLLFIGLTLVNAGTRKSAGS